MAPGITSQDHRSLNGKPERTVSYYAARASTRILELENRCTGNRTVGLNPHPLRQFARKAFCRLTGAIQNRAGALLLASLPRPNSEDRDRPFALDLQFPERLAVERG